MKIPYYYEIYGDDGYDEHKFSHLKNVNTKAEIKQYIYDKCEWIQAKGEEWFKNISLEKLLNMTCFIYHKQYYINDKFKPKYNLKTTTKKG